MTDPAIFGDDANGRAVAVVLSILKRLQPQPLRRLLPHASAAAGSDAAAVRVIESMRERRQIVAHSERGGSITYTLPEKAQRLAMAASGRFFGGRG